MSVFLRLSSVWCEVKAEDWGLLRLLQLRLGAMPTHSGWVTVLSLKFGQDCNNLQN
jgi:hypothetical protein